MDSNQDLKLVLELLAAFAEAQAELEKKSSSKKTKKKKKKKKVGDQLAELEMMMSKLEDGEEMDLETAAATLKMLEEPKKSKKKKIKKEKLPAPFSEEPPISEVLKDIDLNDLSEGEFFKYFWGQLPSWRSWLARQSHNLKVVSSSLTEGILSFAAIDFIF